jgi:hypothetical protein
MHMYSRVKTNKSIGRILINSFCIKFYNSICQIKHLKSKSDMTIIDYTKKVEVKNTEIDFHLLEIDEGLASHLDQHGKYGNL